MGWHFSLGIVFENEKLLLHCKNKFPKEIKLSNNIIVKIIYDAGISENSENSVLQILPLGLNTDLFDGRDILFARPYFYEIRDFLYQQLLHFDFKIALFELEAGDFLTDNDIFAEINKVGTDIFAFGYPNLSNGDTNASSISRTYHPEYYIPKRYLDGLILHESEFELIENKSDFQIFKPNYHWLPIKEFKFSN